MASVPFCGLVGAAGLAWCLLHASAGPAQGDGHRSMSRVCFWLLASAGLLVIFTGQELIEGWTSPGHPGLAGVVGAGGWTVVPLALTLGGFVTLVAGLVERAERTICRVRRARQPRWVAWCAVARQCVLVERAALRASESLARHLAGRGPPAVRFTR